MNSQSQKSWLIFSPPVNSLSGKGLVNDHLSVLEEVLMHYLNLFGYNFDS